MAKKVVGRLALAFGLLAWCNPLSADVISVSGSGCVVPYVPLSRMPGLFESDTCINGFYTSRNVVPGYAFTDYLILTGTQNYGEPVIPGPAVTFGEDAAFDVFLVTFDPVGTPNSPLTLEGSFTFDQDVIVLFTSFPDQIWGGPEAGDWSTLSADRRTLFLHLSAGLHVDQMMVVTTNAEPVPVTEPASLLLLGTGLISAVRAVRWKRG